MIRFIDLFAGLSGIRIGFENAANALGENTECKLTSEIKPAAIEALQHRYPQEGPCYNIYDVKAEMIPDGIDVLLGGFPCQAFSSAGKGLGFMDTRGTLFFEIERLIGEFTEQGHKPKGFLLENVEGLMRHGGIEPGEKYGRTLSTIVRKLELAGYNVQVLLLDSSDYGVPQARKRVYIIGVDNNIGQVDLHNLPKKRTTFAQIREYGLPVDKTPFTEALVKACPIKLLPGKCLKDKRGGARNIHSWDVATKGDVSATEKAFLNQLLKERRKKKWAPIIGIDWMDGMPLTYDQITTFYNRPGLQKMLDELVEKGYLVYEHPKKKIIMRSGNNVSSRREYDTTLPKGYNIVTGKLSFPYTQFLDDNSIAPTMVAMDMDRVGVVEKKGVRHLSISEGLRLFGYDNYDLSYLDKKKNGRRIAFDLLGNSVCVPVIEILSHRLIQAIQHHD